MNLPRVLGAAVILCLIGSPHFAVAAPSGTTWESDTPGIPLSTMQGQWLETEEGKDTELIFTGGHVIEAGTTFRATWITPYTAKREFPTLDYSYKWKTKIISVVRSTPFRPFACATRESAGRRGSVIGTSSRRGRPISSATLSFKAVASGKHNSSSAGRAASRPPHAYMGRPASQSTSAGASPFSGQGPESERDSGGRRWTHPFFGSALGDELER
jgi:hypothetical protein